MEPTFNTRAIILDRQDFRENDSRIICYSENYGKLELVARGAKKLKSKLSGHIEPLTLSRLMVVQGKDVNYAGTATGENFYSSIKEDLNKVLIAKQALSIVEKMTREGEVGGHEEIFNLLKVFLDELEKKSPLLSGGDSDGQKRGVIPAKAGIQIFFEEFSAMLGFSQEDFNELNRK